MDEVQEYIALNKYSIYYKLNPLGKKRMTVLKNTLAEGFLTTVESIEANVIVHERRNEFDFMDCDDMGCWPNLSTKTFVKYLVELKALDGQIFCLNANVLKNKPEAFLGNCK